VVKNEAEAAVSPFYAPFAGSAQASSEEKRSARAPLSLRHSRMIPLRRPCVRSLMTLDPNSIPPGERADGYRLSPRGGPMIRSDIVDVYIFRVVVPGRGGGGGEGGEHAAGEAGAPHPAAGHAESGAVEFLQLLRASEPLAQTWHPVMGHVEHGETAAACALRELDEEVGVSPALRSSVLAGMWALEQVHPFYIAAIDTIVMSPRFAAQVRPDWSPRLNDENAGARWVHERDVERMFMWPGQAAACREVLSHIVDARSLARERLRVIAD